MSSEHGTAGQLLVAHLTDHTARLLSQDTGVRAGEAEAVHGLRITARRLRSALTTFRSLLPAQMTDPVREELRWLGESLGEARDAQVLREHLMDLVGEQSPELVLGRVAARIDLELTEASRAGRERALAALDSARYQLLVGALHEVVAAIPRSADSDTPAKRALTPLVAADVTRLRRVVGQLEAAQDAQSRDLAFHEARKKAKRLRYGAEAAAPAVGKRALSLAGSTKKLQETLGVHQDAVVARRQLRAWGVQAHLDGENGFTFGRLHALEQARAERAEADFAKAWRRFVRRELPRWET